MIVYVLLFMIVFVIIFGSITQRNYRNVERFEDYNKNMMGYEEGLPSEYRKIDYPNIKNPMWNRRDYHANNWHLRFPYMVNQRYSYNDNPTKCKKYPSFYDYANLEDLPLELKNLYYANELTRMSLEYYPDVSNQKYKNNNGKAHHSYPPYMNDYPLLVENGYDVMTNRKKIVGFDYHKMNDITTNTGDGTTDDYYYMDRLHNRIY